jgi:hypothetical protein
MLFKTHQANLKQIKQHITQIGAVYFHGDGNMYPADEEDGKLNSENNVKFSNPKQDESKYRVLFTRVDQVPDTVDELNDMLIAAKNKETLAERAVVSKTGVRTLRANTDDVLTDLRKDAAGKTDDTGGNKGGKGRGGKGNKADAAGKTDDTGNPGGDTDAEHAEQGNV